MIAAGYIAFCDASYLEPPTATPFDRVIGGLRFIHETLEEGMTDPSTITRRHFSLAQEAMRKANLSKSFIDVVLVQMAWIARLMDDYGITRTPLDWQPDLNLSPSSQLAPDVDNASSSPTRDDVLHSVELAAMAHVSNLPDQALWYTDQLKRCVVDLMFCGGFRVGEAITLPVDTWHSEERLDEDGEPMLDQDGRPLYNFALRYWGEKDNAELSMLKALPHALVPVARRAVERALALTEEARRVARHQHEHRTTTLGPPWDDMAPDDLIIDADVATALGLVTNDIAKHGGYKFITNNKVPHVRMARRNAEGRRIVEWFVKKRDLYDTLWTRSFHDACRPRVDHRIQLHQMLFVVHTGLNRDFQGTKGTSGMLSYSSVATYLGRGENTNGPPSVSERLGLNYRGKPVNTSPHQFRVLMNTIAQRCNLGEVQIARWMGRRTVSVNATYDGRSVEERAQGIRRHLEEIGEYAQHDQPRFDPLPESEYAAQDGTAMHVTTLGACLHDYAQSPCTAHVLLISSTTKNGNPYSAAEKARLAAHTKVQLAMAIEEGQAGTVGATAWVAEHRATLKWLGEPDKDISAADRGGAEG